MSQSPYIPTSAGLCKRAHDMILNAQETASNIPSVNIAQAQQCQ